MISAIILAGGTGERFGSKVPKPFMSLNGQPVVQYAIDVIEPFVDEVVVVAAVPYRQYRHSLPGKTRQESVRNALARCSNPEYVIVHDGVRPFVTAEILHGVLAKLYAGAKSVDTAVPVIDGFLDNGVPQSKVGKYISQTPEGFNYAALVTAHRLAEQAGHAYQDDVCLMYGECGALPEVVQGVYLNTKLTFFKDLENAEGILRFRSVCLTHTPNLKGKRFLVLGGRGGIGSACVQALTSQGAFAYVPTKEEADLSKDVTFDLSSYDGVIHSAGEYKDESKILAVNTMSCYSLLKSAEKQAWRGHVVFLSSTSATYGRRGIALYSASKAALNAIIEGTHIDLAAKGIYVNAVAPARVDTVLQTFFSPKADKAEMLTPDFVAERVLRYLDTQVHGQIVYLRNGL